MISDAAKEVNVESHVLRYWEEELHLPIKRNELGHRYYTEEDVECFKQIKSMKEKGLQLKAIKMILKDGKLNMLDSVEKESPDKLAENNLTSESKEEKAKRLQWLLRQMIVEAIEENNESLCREFRESVVKELDYQFRLQEERDEEREQAQIKRGEEYYQKVDELLRKKNTREKAVKTMKTPKTSREKYRKIEVSPNVENTNEKEIKKKGHFFF